MLQHDVGPISIKKALRMLGGWRPTPLADGVRASLAWLQQGQHREQEEDHLNYHAHVQRRLQEAVELLAPRQEVVLGREEDEL